jgi:MFS family permease
MSLRTKAREVKAAGEAERGNFTPTGVPLRAYNWWLDESNSKRASAIRNGARKENFCHFWRVVLFWAPLRKTGYGIYNVAPYVGTLIAIAAIGAFVAGLILSESMLVFVLQLLAVIITVAIAFGGFIAGATIGMGREAAKRNDMPPLKFVVPMFIISLPTALIAYGIAGVVTFWSDNLTQYSKQIMIGLIAAILAGFLAAVGFSSGLATLGLVLASVAAAIALCAVVIAGGYFLADYLSGKRVLAEEEGRKRLHAYMATHNGEFPPEPESEPGRVAKFFSGLGDFIILIAQVVRVNKWKICPLVEVDR